MSERRPFIKERLFCPGPTPVPVEAKLAAVSASVYHRTQAFYDLFLRCRELLAPLMGTQSLPLILTSSGTGAMESAVVNLTAPGDKVLTIRGGKFGERWGKIAQAYECQTTVLETEWGQSASIEKICQYLKEAPDTKAVFLQANETSTGIHFPIEKITAAVREQSDCLIIIDAISSIGAHRMEMDNWGIDCIVSGSQKGFGIPPGLSFIALSDKAWSRLSSRPRFYFDLEKEKKGQDKGATAWTPATSLIASLECALNQLHEIGLDEVIDHHAKMANGVRKAAHAMGLKLLGNTCLSNALTAIALPANIDGKSLVKRLKAEYGAVFSGGQEQLSGKIIRFAHLGFSDRFDVIAGIAALEFALRDEGHDLQLGSGISAFMNSLPN